MDNLIQTIKTKILKNKKNILFVVFFILIFSFDNSFAEDPTKAAETSKNSWYIPLVLISALTGFLGSIIGIFISPDWTTGQIFGLTDSLKQLWVLVSNVVYFIFAFMLIAMAFMNIIGHGKNEYEMKTALPKFIVGILIVPFSWFIVQFVVSITSILTVSVLSLPYDLFKNSIDKNIEIKTNCTLDLHRADKANKGVKGEITKGVVTKGAFEGSTPTKQAAADKAAQSAADERATSAEATNIWKCDKSKTIKEIYSGDSLYSIMSIYTYGILKIDVMDTLKGEELKNLSTITDVFIKLGFDLIFLVVYFLLLLAIAMALFVRGVYLWLFMMLSPTFGLFYFLGDKKGQEFSKKYSFTKFLELALVPVYVSAALSFGLLFVFIASPQIESGNNKVFEKDSIHLNETDTFTIKGLPGSTIGEGENKKTFELGSIGKLLMVFISLAVLWIAVMAALNSAEITKSIVEPINQFGGNVGKLITEAPKYAPILPGGMSMEGMNTAGSQITSSIRSKYGNEPGNKFADDIKQRFNLVGDKTLEALNKLNSKNVSNDGASKKEFLDDVFKTNIDMKNSSHITLATDKIIEGLKIDITNTKNKNIVDKLKTSKTKNEFGERLHELLKDGEFEYKDQILNKMKTPDGKLVTDSTVDEYIESVAKGTSSEDIPNDTLKISEIKSIDELSKHSGKFTEDEIKGLSGQTGFEKFNFEEFKTKHGAIFFKPKK